MARAVGLDLPQREEWFELLERKRVAQLAIGAWAEHEEKENVRDYDSLILHTRDLLAGVSGAVPVSAGA